MTMRLIPVIFAIVIGMVFVTLAQAQTASTLKERYTAETSAKIKVELAATQEEGHGYWLVLKADTFDPDTGIKSQRQEWIKSDHVEIEVQKLEEQVVEAEKSLATLKKSLENRKLLYDKTKTVLEANKAILQPVAKEGAQQ